MGKIWTPRFFFFEISKVHEQKCWTHEKTTRKNFRPTKYLREKNSDLRNTHEKKFWTHDIPTKAQWHDGTRPTMARNPQNLAHYNRASLHTALISKIKIITVKLPSQNNEILVEVILGPFFTLVERFWGKACTFELMLVLFCA